MQKDIHSASDDDETMQAIDDYEPSPPEMIEKSLTNFNINIACIRDQMKQQNKYFEEFTLNFKEQQKIMAENITQLTIVAQKIVKEMKQSIYKD